MNKPCFFAFQVLVALLIVLSFYLFIFQIWTYVIILIQLLAILFFIESTCFAIDDNI